MKGKSKMKVNELVSWPINAFTYALAYIQANEVMQIVEFAFAILTSIVLLLYRLYVWYKEAKKDGKIDKEEIKEGIDIIASGVEDIKKVKEKKGDKNANNQ